MLRSILLNLGKICSGAMAAFVLSACLTGCGSDNKTDSGESVFPRPYAYPRIQVPDSSFVINDALPYSLQTNAQAHATLKKTEPGSQWVDVVYPTTGATIHYTFTTAATPVHLSELIDNRIERIELNAGGASTEDFSFMTPTGMESHVFVSRSLMTPVQFIASDGNRSLVSGVAWISVSDDVSFDSIAPVVDMLRRDIVHSLKTLHQ